MRVAVVAVAASALASTTLLWRAADATFTAQTSNPGTQFAAGSLQPPTGLSASATCSGSTPSVSASWTAAVGGVTPTGYHLERILAGVTQTTITSATTSATDTGMASGSTYTYRLTAYRGNWSSSAVTTTVTPSCATNLITNSGFETGANAAPWKNADNGNWGEIVGSPAHAGTKSMRVAVSLRLYTTITVTANTNYTFKVWAYTGTGTNSAKLQALRGPNTWDPEIAAVQGTGPAATWNQVTLSFNSGTATSVTLIIGTGTSQYDVFIDDVSLS